MDIRSALIRSLRLIRTRDALERVNVSRSRIGPGTVIEEASPTEEGPAGYAKPVGALYNATIVIKDLSLLAAVEEDAMNLEEYDIEINYAGETTATARQMTMEAVGFTFQPMRSGSAGTFEGFQINAVGYGASSDDIITISPAIVTA